MDSSTDPTPQLNPNERDQPTSQSPVEEVTDSQSPPANQNNSERIEDLVERRNSRVRFTENVTEHSETSSEHQSRCVEILLNIWYRIYGFCKTKIAKIASFCFLGFNVCLLIVLCYHYMHHMPIALYVFGAFIVIQILFLMYCYCPKHGSTNNPALGHLSLIQRTPQRPRESETVPRPSRLRNPFSFMGFGSGQSINERITNWLRPPPYVDEPPPYTSTDNVRSRDQTASDAGTSNEVLDELTDSASETGEQ